MYGPKKSFLENKYLQNLHQLYELVELCFDITTLCGWLQKLTQHQQALSYAYFLSVQGKGAGGGG